MNQTLIKFVLNKLVDALFQNITFSGVLKDFLDKQGIDEKLCCELAKNVIDQPSLLLNSLDSLTKKEK